MHRRSMVMVGVAVMLAPLMSGCSYNKFVAQELGGDYLPGMGSWVKMPPINVGRWTDVHLQYRRWLASEEIALSGVTDAVIDRFLAVRRVLKQLWMQLSSCGKRSPMSRCRSAVG